MSKKISIDWGRQGGVILAYIVIMLSYYGIVANTLMFDQYGDWISFEDFDRTLLFWTYRAYLSSIITPILFILILVLLMGLIIFFSLYEWHSKILLSILIPVYLVYTLDILSNVLFLGLVIETETFFFTFQGFMIIILFLVCLVLTYKEDIPQYGIKASLWFVPFIIAFGFLFYTIMFGASFEPFILQFGSPEGLMDILILFLTVISGSLSGMKFKKERMKKLRENSN